MDLQYMINAHDKGILYQAAVIHYRRTGQWNPYTLSLLGLQSSILPSLQDLAFCPLDTSYSQISLADEDHILQQAYDILESAQQSVVQGTTDKANDPPTFDDVVYPTTYMFPYYPNVASHSTNTSSNNLLNSTNTYVLTSLSAPLAGPDQRLSNETRSLQPKSKASRRKPRRPNLDVVRRAQIALTKQNRACMRCTDMRVICEPDPDDPAGCCLTCSKLKRPTLSGLPCLRLKLKDITIWCADSKPRSQWNNRGHEMSMVDLVGWASTEVKTISITQNIQGVETYNLQVRQFSVKDGDVLVRDWVTNGKRYTYICAPYAIVNKKEAARTFKGFLRDNVRPIMDHYVRNADPLVRETIVKAGNHCSTADTKEERDLMGACLFLWAGIRTCSRSDNLFGRETLGMQPHTEDSRGSNHNRVLLPPMIGSQLEEIVTIELMRPLNEKVFTMLHKMIVEQKSKNWFTIYLCTFVLLHNCALYTAFERRQAVKHALRRRYANPEWVGKLHLGARALIAHFHYYNKGQNPLRGDLVRLLRPKDSTHIEKHLTFLQQTWSLYEVREPLAKSVRERHEYEHELFFISQLFDKKWEP